MATRHVLATVAHRALRSDRLLTWQRPDSPISDVGAMQGGRLRKSLLQGDRWLEGCVMRCASACGVAKLAAVKNRGPGRGKRPFQAWSAWQQGATRGARPKGFRRFDESFGTRRMTRNDMDERCAFSQRLGFVRLLEGGRRGRSENASDSRWSSISAFDQKKNDEERWRWRGGKLFGVGMLIKP